VLKFLIDECLTLDLVEVARQRGFPQSSHVVWMGKAGWKDWELGRRLGFVGFEGFQLLF
jgi:hypothetical protein